MKIASWNINSIKVRLPNVTTWLKKNKPDVLLMQELKGIEENFPFKDFEKLGYQAAVAGQKTYNGVAILSKHTIKDVLKGLPGDKKDEQARYIEATIEGLRIASVYTPNGNPVDSDKFNYKLKWLDRLYRHVGKMIENETPFVLGGDYNVIPHASDCHDPKAWADDALFRLESREKLRAILNLGVTDAFRALHTEPHAYTFWDYQGGAWQKDHGIRIDHILLSPQTADRLVKCEIDRAPRGQDKASDHTPIIAELAA